MKNLILILILMTLLTAPASAKCDYPTRCATYTPNMLSKTSQFISNATGSTLVAEKIAQSIIQKELMKSTGQDFKAEVKAFSVADLIGGKFKSITISGKNVLVDGIKFSSLTVKTVCDYNHIDVLSHPLKFKENVVLDFSMEFSGEDLKSTAQDLRYAKQFNSVNLSEIGIASYQIKPETINIENDKLCFTMKAKPTGPFRLMDIVTSTNLQVENGKIVSSRMNLINVHSDFDLTELSNLPKIIKTLNFKLNFFGNKGTEVQIEKISISGGKLLINGMAFIPKTVPQFEQQSKQTVPRQAVPVTQPTQPQKPMKPFETIATPH